MATFRTKKYPALSVDPGTGPVARFAGGTYMTEDEAAADSIRAYATQYPHLGITEDGVDPETGEPVVDGASLREELEAMSVEQLKELAVDKGADLKGLRKKADIIDAILGASPPADQDPDASAIGDSTLATLPPGHPDAHDVVAPGEPPSNEQGTDGEKAGEGE